MFFFAGVAGIDVGSVLAPSSGNETIDTEGGLCREVNNSILGSKQPSLHIGNTLARSPDGLGCLCPEDHADSKPDRTVG